MQSVFQPSLFEGPFRIEKKPNYYIVELEEFLNTLFYRPERGHELFARITVIGTASGAINMRILNRDAEIFSCTLVAALAGRCYFKHSH